MLGPVGISLNEGLSAMVDREVSILGRKKAFEQGSPLEMPDSAAGREVAPTFTSPLDRLRRMGELVGMQRLVEFGTVLGMGDPARIQVIAERFDDDEMLDAAQEILGAPVKTLKPKEQADEARAQTGQQQQMMTALAALKGGGDAAKAVGEGGAAMAGGAEAATGSPALRQLMQNAPAVTQQIQNGIQPPAAPQQ
jgi:hypothetical protein